MESFTKFRTVIFVVLIAWLFGFLPSYAQSNEFTIRTDTLRWITLPYSSPYVDLAGHPFNDSLIAIYTNYPSGDIEIQFGNTVRPLDDMNNAQLKMAIKIILRKWDESIRR